jgi:hypothetical protein
MSRPSRSTTAPSVTGPRPKEEDAADDERQIDEFELARLVRGRGQQYEADNCGWGGEYGHDAC